MHALSYTFLMHCIMHSALLLCCTVMHFPYVLAFTVMRSCALVYTVIALFPALLRTLQYTVMHMLRHSPIDRHALSQTTIHTVMHSYALPLLFSHTLLHCYELV